MIRNTVNEIFTVHGDFEPLCGEVKKIGGALAFRGSGLLLTSREIKDESGVTERIDTVKNVSKKPISITTLLSKFTLNGGEYSVYTQTSQHIRESQGAFCELVSGIYGMSDELRTNQDVCPFVAVFNEQNQRGYAFHIMSSSMFEYRVSRHCEFLSPKVVTVELGIRSDNFDYKLMPGEELELPRILYYEFKSKLDLDAYKLHRYCNKKYKKPLPIMYNTWMSNFDLIEFEDLKKQLDGAAELGCEYFTVDAGWFGKTQLWWDVVGDWTESPESAMKGNLSKFADLVRDKGLKFGLWFEIERASCECENVKKHPDYYIRDGKHCYLDFARREVCDFIYAILKENIEKYKIEFIKFDLNGPLTIDKARACFLKYYEGFKYFLSLIKKDYPSLHLQCCASGGGRMSMSNVPYYDSFWISDNHGIYTQLEIYKNTIKRMPCAALERWATIRSLEDFTPTYPVGGKTEKILLSSDASWIRVEEADISFIKNGLMGGPLGVSCDLTQVSKATLGELKSLIAAYKEEREFWQSSECHILCDTPTLTILQFNDEKFEKIKVYSFTKHPNQEAVTVYPITANGSYILKKGEGEAALSSRKINGDGIEMNASKLRQSDSFTLIRR